MLSILLAISGIMLGCISVFNLLDVSKYKKPYTKEELLSIESKIKSDILVYTLLGVLSGVLMLLSIIKGA